MKTYSISDMHVHSENVGWTGTELYTYIVDKGWHQKLIKNKN